jgi:hypothetical protein
MTDAKGFTSQTARTESLKPWMTRLRPALSTSLLDVRLIGEYCLSRLSWSPVLRSKRTVITDADAEGFGRSLLLRSTLPEGVSEPKSSAGWYAALSAEPLSELAGASSVFSWGVRVDENEACTEHRRGLCRCRVSGPRLWRM